MIGAWWRGRSRRGRSRIAHFVAAFRAGLREAGFVEGQAQVVDRHERGGGEARSGRDGGHEGEEEKNQT